MIRELSAAGCLVGGGALHRIHQKRKKRNYRSQLQLLIMSGIESLQESAPWHAVFAFLDTLLIGVIQIKCQNTKESSYEANEVIMWIFVVTIFIYCFALAASMKLHNPLYSGLARNVSLLAGSLSSVSLVSVLLPYYPKLIMFVLWAVLPLMLARTSIRRICKSLCQGTMAAIHRVISLWNLFWGINNSTEESRPSV